MVVAQTQLGTWHWNKTNKSNWFVWFQSQFWYCYKMSFPPLNYIPADGNRKNCEPGCEECDLFEPHWFHCALHESWRWVALQHAWRPQANLAAVAMSGLIGNDESGGAPDDCHWIEQKRCSNWDRQTVWFCSAVDFWGCATKHEAQRERQSHRWWVQMLLNNQELEHRRTAVDPQIWHVNNRPSRSFPVTREWKGNEAQW